MSFDFFYLICNFIVCRYYYAGARLHYDNSSSNDKFTTFYSENYDFVNLEFRKHFVSQSGHQDNWLEFGTCPAIRDVWSRYVFSHWEGEFHTNSFDGELFCCCH